MKNKKTLTFIITEILVCAIVFFLVVLFCLNFFKVVDFVKEDNPSGKPDSSYSDSVTAEDVKIGLNRLAAAAIGSYRFTGPSISDASSDNLTFAVSTDSPETVVEEYVSYVESLGCTDCNYLVQDLDSDGKNEYFIEIRNSLDDFCNAVGESETASYVEQVYSDISESEIGIIIFGFCDENNLVFRGMTLSTLLDENRARLENGNLIFGFDGAEVRNFVGFPDKVYEDYEGREDEFNNLCASYCSYDESMGFETRFQFCDASDVKGTAVVISYLLDGDMYSEVYTAKDGMLHPIYSIPFEQQATYLVKIDSEEYIMTYTQDLGMDTEDYTTSYRYTVFRIGENYKPSVYEEMSTIVKAESYTEDNGIFFEKFNSYLKNATVCSDPYKLKGYRLAPYSTGINGKAVPLAEYLVISNCGTSKQGVVKVDEESYLNLRIEPSVNEERVTISSEPVVYAKLNKGETVTVIDTANTESSANPVWVRIEAKYAGFMVTGYTSKKYIELDSVKKIKVGEKFTVTAEGSNSELRWSSNDESVAKIDEKTGEVTGVSKGLVMISVTSASGLEDTCLIEVVKE